MWRRLGIVFVLVVGICYSFPVDNEPSSSTTEDPTELPEDTPMENINLNRYRFHEEKKRYFKIGDTDVCNDNMRFFAAPDDMRLGRCDCDWYQCSRPLLYDDKSDKCYLAWSTGPCAAGEWTTFGEKMLPVCQKHPCPETPITETDNGSSFYFQNPKDSKCYEAGTQGYCGADEGLLMIYPLEPIPICRTSTLCYALMTPASQQCIQGNKWHQTPNSNCTF